MERKIKIKQLVLILKQNFDLRKWVSTKKKLGVSLWCIQTISIGNNKIILLCVFVIEQLKQYSNIFCSLLYQWKKFHFHGLLFAKYFINEINNLQVNIVGFLQRMKKKSSIFKYRLISLLGWLIKRWKNRITSLKYRLKPKLRSDAKMV